MVEGARSSGEAEEVYGDGKEMGEGGMWRRRGKREGIREGKGKEKSGRGEGEESGMGKGERRGR